MDEAEIPAPSPGLVKAITLLEIPSVLVGKLGAWLILPMVGALVYEVVSRYIFNAPTIWAYDITYILAGAVCSCSGPLTHCARAVTSGRTSS